MSNYSSLTVEDLNKKSRMPTRFHLDKTIKHFNAAVYQIEDLMMMYSKAGRKDVARELRADVNRVTEVYSNLNILRDKDYYI